MASDTSNSHTASTIEAVYVVETTEGKRTPTYDDNSPVFWEVSNDVFLTYYTDVGEALRALPDIKRQLIAKNNDTLELYGFVGGNLDEHLKELREHEDYEITYYRPSTLSIVRKYPGKLF